MVASSEKLVPAPMSVPSPTWTGRSGSFALSISNRPLPRNRFEVGQCEIDVPVSWQRAHSRSVEVDAVARHRAAARAAVVVVDVEIARRAPGTAPSPTRSRRRSRRCGVCTKRPGAPATASPAGSQLLGRARGREARRDRVEAAARARATSRSAPSSRRSRVCAVSSRPSGALRSISTLPAIMRVPRALRLLEEARRPSAGRPRRRPRAVVVPLASSWSKKTFGHGVGVRGVARSCCSSTKV